MGSADHGKLGLPPAEKEAENKGWSRYKRQGDRLKTANAQENSRMGVVNVDGKKVKQVACGFQHTVCLTEDGDVYSWGLSRFGALG